MYRLKTIFIITVIHLLGIMAYSQQAVTGNVSDTNGEAIIGASILQKGTTNGTVSDIDGNFTINAATGSTIQISYIGYITQEVVVTGQPLSVILLEDTRTLDEVVVVGFGTQRKVNLTGSVGTASAKDIEARPVASATQALQGVIPGLNISTQGNGGELNSTKSINIRGTTTIGQGSSGSPLILIDGMEGNLNTINPQDIANISVLKDAAAASIYGSRAPFGVILITTKEGEAGKTVINYNNSFRFNTPVLLPDMQNSWEFVNFFDDANFNVSNSHLYSDNYKQLVKDYFDGKKDPTDVAYPGSGGKWNYDYTYANVDWLKEYYMNWSPSQEHNVSASGGNEKYTYYVSGNFLDQKGFFRHGRDMSDRYALTGKISAKLNKYVKADYTSRLSRNEYSRPSNMNDGFYDHILRRARPVRAIKDPNGYYMSDINYIQTMAEGGRHKEQNDELAQQLRLTITPLKNWNIIGEMNFKKVDNWTHWDQVQVFSHYADDPEKTYKALTSPNNDQVYEGSYRYTFLNPNIYSNYSISLNEKHNFSAILGFQSEIFDDRGVNAQRADMINTTMPILDLTTNVENMSMGGAYNKWRTAGFFGRINYDYQGRYLAELNLRYDGSSRFRSENRWVWTPSASFGWNIAQEEFWHDYADTVNLLKLRFSYGELANQNTSNWYPTYQTIWTGAAEGQWLINNAKPNIAAVPGLISTNLTWEKVNHTNIGLDYGAFRNRLTGYFDYYIRNTLNMVGPGVELPVILGTGVPATNNTDLQTSGWEFQIGWRDQVGAFSYGARFNLSDSRTKITKYPNPTNSLSKYREGEYINNIYGYTTVGIAKTDDEMQNHLSKMENGGQNPLGSNWAAGDIMYADLNGDGKVDWGDNTTNNPGDLRVIGNSTPRFRTGLNLEGAWKGIELLIFFQGVLKRDFDPGENSMVFWGATGGGQWWSTAFTEHLDYYRADESHPLGQNLDAYYPRPLFNNKNHKTQTGYLQNAAYMRLKNLQLGYSLPSQLVERIGLSRVKLFVSGENLATFTKLSKTMDPETAGIGRQGGTVYPLSKTYSFGVNVNF